MEATNIVIALAIGGFLVVMYLLIGEQLLSALANRKRKPKTKRKP